MENMVTSDKVEELIWHALTANGVVDMDFLLDWSWSSASEMENLMGLTILKRDYQIIPVVNLFFSPHYFGFATPKQRESTIVHETCHVVVALLIGSGKHYEDPHGEDWKEAMRRAGYTPTVKTIIQVPHDQLDQYNNFPLTTV